MKKIQMILTVILAVTILSGCVSGTRQVKLRPGVSGKIAVLSLGADTSNLSQDQIALLNQTLSWMDHDMIQVLQRSGLTPTRIMSEQDYSGDGGSYLLKITITDHRMIPKGARFWAGMMAGADNLSAHFDLVDKNRRTVLSWDDTQGSTKGGTYCAQTLNRNAADRLANFLGTS